VTSASWEWTAQPSLILDTPAGELSIVRDTHGPLDLDSLAPVLNVRRRQGGETLRPHAKARSRKLKSLLQEARIPLADRDRLPLIYVADKLIAVGDRWLDASARAAPGAVRRGRIRWQPK
jgi:tRNA(Ile)-lysidine synthase